MSDLVSDRDEVRWHIAETHVPAKRPSDRIAQVAAPAKARPYVDPAAEAMSQNHDLSASIQWVKRDGRRAEPRALS